MMKRRRINLSNDTNQTCNNEGCSNIPKRSIPRKRAEKSDMLNLIGSGRKVNLCQECYRQYKKSTKKDRTLESLGR